MTEARIIQCDRCGEEFETDTEIEEHCSEECFPPISEHDIETMLVALLEELDMPEARDYFADEAVDTAAQIESVRTLEDGGFMTTDRGIAIEFRDGSEVTVHIKRYRNPQV